MVDVESKLSDCEYGLVMLGEHQLTKQTVAVRIVIKDRLQKEGKVRRLAKQIALQRKLHHSTIVRLFQLIETVDSIYLVFEWVDGIRLSELIGSRKRQPGGQGRLKEQQLVRIVYELLLALEYLRRQHIAHCNLSPENVYYLRGDHIKITGFENSKQYFQQQKQPPLTSRTQFCSQRSLNGQTAIERSYGDPFEADVHDAGVIFSELLYAQGTSPSKSNRNGSVEGFSQQARNLLGLMLNRTKEQKVPLTQLRAHAWFQKQDKRLLLNISNETTVQPRILKQLELFGIDRKYALKCIMKNQCNYVTTLYWLLRTKRTQQQRVPSGTGGSKSPPLVSTSIKTTKEFASQKTLELKMNHHNHPISTNSKSKKKFPPRPPKSKQKKRHSNEPRNRPNKRSAAKKFTIYESSTDRRNSIEKNHRSQQPIDPKPAIQSSNDHTQKRNNPRRA